MSEVLKFLGVTAMALIFHVTVLAVRDLLGPDGADSICRKRERLFRKDQP